MFGEQPSYKRGLVHYGRVVFPYNPKYCESQKAFETMFAAITTFMARMQLYLIVLDKSNVCAQFMSWEPLGVEWDKGANILPLKTLPGDSGYRMHSALSKRLNTALDTPNRCLK